MARGRPRKPQSGDGESAAAQGATTGYEAELWSMADALRGSMDAAEYKHVVLGLIFLKYISDAFEERHASSGRRTERKAPTRRTGRVPRSRTSSGCRPRPAGLICRPRRDSPPSVSSWTTPMERPSSATTRRSRTCCPKEYARPALDKQRLGQLIDLVSNIQRWAAEQDARSTDVLGRVYEYFLDPSSP